MRKIGHLILLCGFIGLLYLLMMAFQPATNTIIESANSSINWTAHKSFGLAQAAMVGWPFWVYLIPAGIGIPLAVAIIKGEK